MTHTKYICVHQFSNGVEAIITFPDTVEHADMANGVDNIGTVISAGFCDYIVNGGCYNGVMGLRGSCFGESTSLKLKSRPEEDTILLNYQIGGPK